MKLKELESRLSCVRLFEEPNVMLEQYPTSAHIAARILYTAQQSFEDIEGRVVGDFGCGTGMLTCAAAILGCERVIGIDIDDKALRQAAENVQRLDLSDRVELIRGDLSSPPLRDGEAPFDTIVMNPPFGTRVRGIDMTFLTHAIRSCSRAVYSLNKTSTRLHIQKTAGSLGALGSVIATLRFDIPKMYAFHKKTSADVEVDLWRFVPNADVATIDAALEKMMAQIRLSKREERRSASGRGKGGRRAGGGGNEKGCDRRRRDNNKRNTGRRRRRA